MKRKLLTAAAAVAVAVVLPLLTGPGAASSAAPKTAQEVACLPGGGVAATVLPVSARDHVPADAVPLEGFFCGDTPAAQLKATKAAVAAGKIGKAAPATATQSLIAADANDGAYVCVSAGCWHRVTGWNAAWKGAGYYGVSVRYADGSMHYLTLGKLDWYFTDIINGRETSTSPQSAMSNRAIATWKWADERYYVSGGCPAGCSNPDPYRMVKVQTWQGSKAPGIGMSWYPVYLSSLNFTASSVAYATTYHVIQFKDWDARYNNILFWAKTKDFKMKRLWDGAYYYVYDALSLPSSPVSVGTSAV